MGQASGLAVNGEFFASTNPNATGPTAVCLAEALNYSCDTYGGKMTSATTWLGLLGVCLTGFLLTRKSRVSIMVTIVFITILSWIPGTDVSYFSDAVMPGGPQRFEYFKSVVKVRIFTNLDDHGREHTHAHAQLSRIRTHTHTHTQTHTHTHTHTDTHTHTHYTQDSPPGRHGCGSGLQRFRVWKLVDRARDLPLR
jgi:hypothetical protein